jgi:hypothetical protein
MPEGIRENMDSLRTVGLQVEDTKCEESRWT